MTFAGLLRKPHTKYTKILRRTDAVSLSIRVLPVEIVKKLSGKAFSLGALALLLTNDLPPNFGPPGTSSVHEVTSSSTPGGCRNLLLLLAIEVFVGSVNVVDV